MAIGEYYSVPEIDPTTATDEVFGSFMKEIRSMDKAASAGEQFGDLARRRPEELPPCFLAVKADALSPRTGWETEHGKWEPKDMYIDNLYRKKSFHISDPLFPSKSIPLIRTTLVFRPKDGSKSNLAIDMYNAVNPATFFLEEDMALCHVFRVRKEKGKGLVPSEASFWGSLLELSDNPFHDFTKRDFLDNHDILRAEKLKEAFSYFNEDLGWDMPSNDYFGGPKKRPRSKPPVGGSGAWDSFTRIYTKDPDVVYAACHHCGRLMKLKGGAKCGTKSLLRHNETCPCKPVID